MSAAWRGALQALRDRARARLAATNPRDRRLVMVLAAFLACAAYYQWVFEPLEASWHQGQERLRQHQQRLFTLQNKVHQARKAQQEQARLQEAFDSLVARMAAPAAGQPLADVLAGVNRAAEIAGVRLVALRPLQAAGKTEVTAVTVDAAATSESWMNFLDRLWGMRVAELSLAKGDDPRYPLRAYARLELLPPPGLAAAAELPRPEALRLAADPFAPKPPAASATTAKEAEPAPEPVPAPVAVLDLDGVRLIARMSLPGGPVVVLSDKGRERVMAVGERLRTYALQTIDETGAVFVDEGGTTGRVGFARPTTATVAEAGAPAATAVAAAPRKPGRLGVGIRLEAAADGSPGGLRITQARPDTAELRAGDLIVAINGVPTPTTEAAQRVMRTVSAGDSIDVAVVRAGQDAKARIVALE